MIAVLVLGSIGAATAFGDAGGTPNGGNSDVAHANRDARKAAASSDSSHDPSNPDGTYQGKSPSRPDQDGIGADHGIVNNDKTGPGTDGNNGCGNDPDREDDNNGWCGARPANVKPTESPTPGETETPEVSPNAQPGAEVLGRTFTRPEVLGRNLARTGIPLTAALIAIVLGIFGFALRAITSSRRV
jgi:hypothetical protein